MTIQARDIYEALGLPVGLRLHMARTVALVCAVCDQQESDCALAMALHDVGNIVKLRIDDASGWAMLDEPESQRGRWTLYARSARAMYGADDHLAAQQMLRALQIRDELIEFIESKSSARFREIQTGESRWLRLALYADMRVDPSGVVSIERRLAEANARYEGRSRRGLGGDMLLSDLEKLEQTVLSEFDARLPESLEVEAKAGDYLSLPMDNAFAPH